MSDDWVVLERDSHLSESIGRVSEELGGVSRSVQCIDPYQQGALQSSQPPSKARWITPDESYLGPAYAAKWFHGKSLIVLDSNDAAWRPFAQKRFDHVLVADAVTRRLPLEELIHALFAPNRSNLFVAIAVNRQLDAALLHRGDLRTLAVPLSAFQPMSDGTSPDFSDYAVTDYGQTIRFGDYEAASDGVLYDFDPAYHRKVRAHLRSEDQSFGSSLRRLRLQRRLGQDAFEPDVSSRQVGRIERGEVAKPHAKTLATLAKRLDVEPGEIEEF